MIVYFCRGTGILAEAIKLATLSHFSHCAVNVNGIVYESTIEKGVTKCSLNSFADRYPNRETIIVDGNNDLAETWLNKQIGKDYDFTALAGIPLRKKWNDDNKWFCSELVAEALVKSGVLNMRLKTHRVTPRDLWYAYKMRWNL